MEKTIEIQLQELREQIASEIEGGQCQCEDDVFCDLINKNLKWAAKIARGK